MTISKRQTTQYNHFCKVRRSLHELFSRTKSFKLSFPEYLELKQKMYINHPSMGKRKNGQNKLNKYYRGVLNGIEETLFGLIQTQEVEWLHYYKDEKGKTIYVKKWSYLPKEIRYDSTQTKFKSNHFWKGTVETGKPRPWGEVLEIF